VSDTGKKQQWSGMARGVTAAVIVTDDFDDHTTMGVKLCVRHWKEATVIWCGTAA